ncbi:MAG: extracellular solute-binding protein [Oscillospiraceae bacterium]|nr:extracellular solute-binding protein [Oscillospiraceae bacterium]
MKRRIILIFVLCVTLAFVVLPLCFAGNFGDTLPDAAGRHLSVAAERWNVYEVTEAYELGGLSIPKGEMVSVPITLPEAGNYRVALTYTLPDPAVLDAVFTVGTAQGESRAILPVLWSDSGGPFPVDRYGNELNRDQAALTLPVTAALRLQGAVGADDLLLPAGGSVLTLRPDTQAIILERLLLLPEQSEPATPAAGKLNGELITLEAENYTLKSDSFIRTKGVRNPVLSPYDTYSRKMNAIDENSWDTAGQKILWTFEVPEAGLYNAGFRYSQVSRPGKRSYRRLEIDGLPVSDALIPFAPTRLDEYKNYTADGSVYLEKGIHTLALTSVLGPEESVYHELMRIMGDLSGMGMDLKILTAGNTDPNRTWDMNAYLPEIPGRLLRAAKELERCYADLSAGTEPIYASDLLYASEVLRRLCEDTRTLPNKAGLISEGDASISASVSNVLQTLLESPLSLDRIYLTSGAPLPGDSVSPFTQIAESIRTFAHTFSAGASGYAVDGSGDAAELQVWVGMSVQHTEVLQQLINQKFNETGGKNIQLSIMPNPQKLVLANATGTGPDVVLGVPFYLPYDFAIRGAAKNLLEYQDFLSIYAKQYNLEGLVPLSYDGGVHGAVESVNFQVLYYRNDIMEKLGLSLPDTWDDVVGMMPDLLRNEMNFNLSLANNIGFKTFNTTSPFIYQNKGSFFSADGASSAFTEGAAVNGFTQMTDLFSAYSLSEYVANFFNAFRYGEVPIGVGGYDMYMRLSVAAPELQGLWDIALTPGHAIDGEVLRYQSADSTACMIFSDSDKTDEAWEFLKWWLSEETQVRFSYQLENTYGTEYRWNTANLGAFTQLPYPEEHKAVILEQLRWQKENIRHPAGYMVEREASNVWNNVVANHKEIMASIDRAKIASDREILRKLREFGFVSAEGEVLRPYPIDTIGGLSEGAGDS